MLSNKIKELAPTVQSILVSLAILSGGVWAIITQTPYWEAKSIIENLKSSIMVTMSAKQVLLPKNTTSKKTIIVEVTMENTGGQTVTYEFARRPLLISQQVPVDKQNTFRNGKTYEGKYLGEENQPTFGMLAPDGKITYQFAALVDDPGLYSILFKATPAGSEDEERFYYASRKLIVLK